VLFAAGGTGGHVFPAVAVADALVAASNRNALPDDREVHVSFAGTAGRQEARLVPAAGYELHVVPAVSLARPLSSPANVVKNLFALPFRLAWCLWKAFALLAKLRPHVVVGTGGYVSLPVCFAAALRRIPMCVQEQNAHPGMANRVLAPLADRVFVAFRAAADALLRAKTHRIHGNPVRKSLRDITRTDARRKARFWFSMACGGGYKGQLREGDPNDVVLLILGGSLGASAINRAAARAIPELLATHENLWVVWQTGADGHERAVAAVAEKFAEKSNVRCTVDGRACKFPRLSVVPFIDEMDAAYGASDLVVARAGAITCAELGRDGNTRDFGAVPERRGGPPDEKRKRARPSRVRRGFARTRTLRRRVPVRGHGPRGRRVHADAARVRPAAGPREKCARWRRRRRRRTRLAPPRKSRRTSRASRRDDGERDCFFFRYFEALIHRVLSLLLT
jgi:UDP-N-acetylglucosamine--N-acetylmuramyl-(pentapeptide) pyrophosphoryl-undecaprenol N-acetylglucosamine transferase